MGPFNVTKIWKRLFEDMTIQKQEGIQGPILGRCCHLVVERQIRQKGADFWRTHLLGMAFVMKQDEAFDPAEVGDFRAVAHMLEP